MGLIVQKYGGTSVGSAERMKNVAQRIKETKECGNDVIVVVSAMGDTTDNLIALAKQITPYPNKRELDALLATGEMISATLLAITLNSIGCEAISFNASQARILTDKRHTDAKIINIDPSKIKENVKKGKVVVITGFQGITEEGEWTTLGRGGSDATAVALAYFLGANICEIYTDVDGVYSADPRLVKRAKKLKSLSYEEMLEFASLGSKVLQPKSVIYAKRWNIILHVRSSFSKNEGTIIKNEMEEERIITGISLQEDEARVDMLNVPDRPGIAAKIFEALAKDGINIDMIIQSGGQVDRTNLSFTLKKEDLDRAIEIVKCIAQELGAKISWNSNIAIISLIGVGMKTQPGVAAKMFKTLADLGINIQMISTSEIKISCVIGKDKAKEALEALHNAFF